MIYMLRLFHVVFFVYGNETGNKTVSPSKCFGFFLGYLWSHRLNIELFLVIIETLLVFINVHEKTFLDATFYPQVRENVTCHTFTTKGVLYVITEVTFIHNCTVSISFPQLIQ